MRLSSRSLQMKKLPMATAKTLLTDEAEMENPNNVKVIVDRAGNALYFSRARIPYARNPGAKVYKHIGIYAYRRDFLLAYARMAQTPLELSESLEQLRALENGHRIRVIETDAVFIARHRGRSCGCQCGVSGFDPGLTIAREILIIMNINSPYKRTA